MQAEAPPSPQQNPWTPPSPEPIVFQGFKGLNTNASRPGIEDDEMYWCDGFMPIGKNFLRTLYDIGDSVFNVTPPQIIVWFGFANISATPYCIVLLSDGSIIAVNMSTLSASQLCAAGTIQNPAQNNIGMTQWGTTIVIISAIGQPNGYFLWDGTTFYFPGDTAPNGDPVPFAIAGAAIETYQGRVFIANGPTIGISAPGSYTDFSSASGGVSFNSTDSFLRVYFSSLKQTNGFIYLIGDSSINYISGIQTSGSPPTTTFTNNNADPEIGTPWPWTVTVFSRNIVLANSFGAHVSYGGAVTKTSDALDGFYNSSPNFSGLIPSAAKATIFGRKVWMLLLGIVNPFTGQTQNKLCMWDSKRWWTASQSINLTFISEQEILSQLTAYGTDGNSIYPLFQRPSASLLKVVQSRLWEGPGGYEHIKGASRLWGLVQYYSLDSPDLEISIDNETGKSPQQVSVNPTVLNWTNNVGGPIIWTNNSGNPIEWFGSGAGVVVFPPQAVAQNGALIGLTLQTFSADMALLSLKVGSELVQYRG